MRLSIIATILGTNEHCCYPAEHLGLPVLTWHSAGLSSSPAPCNIQKGHNFQMREKGGTAFLNKEENVLYKGEHLTEEEE